MEVNRKTKKDIIDELKTRNCCYYGALENGLDFFDRLVDTKKLPSLYSNYSNMQEEIKNRNDEYVISWSLLEDDRLKIFENDDLFLLFLCETLHPTIRPNEDERYFLLEIINSYLIHQGVQLVEDKKVHNGNTFKAMSIQAIDIEFDLKSDNEFVVEQYQKIKEKIEKNDYDGAITNTRSFLEGVFDDIHFRILDKNIEKSGDLKKNYQTIRKILKLDNANDIDSKLKGFSSSIVNIISCIDELSNQCGDRHRRIIKPSENLSRFCMNIFFSLALFLYNRLKNEYGEKESMYKILTEIIGYENKFKDYNELSKIPFICNFLQNDINVLKLVKDKLINEFNIKCFHDSDIFFTILNLFINILTKEDILLIKDKCNKSVRWDINQAVGFSDFMNKIKIQRSDLM